MILAEQLKIATDTNHQQLEKQLVLRMKAIRTVPEYINLLQLFYTYFGGLEDTIKNHIGTSHLRDYSERRKTDALAEDITALGGTIQPKASAADLPLLQNYLQAFGALYVIEGSTLGGQIISKMIAKQLQLPEGNGLSFFNGYGETSGEMWDRFKTALNAQAQHPADEAEVISAANETFVKFKQWIEKNS
ncbi:biliverdin-producing heme oxygenase [Mucilaginibacter koreensis]